MNLPTRPCKHCHRPIALILTTTGRRMPIDAEPALDGNVYLTYENGQLLATVVGKGDPPAEGVAFMPHWATCPALTRRKTKPVVEQPALDLG